VVAVEVRRDDEVGDHAALDVSGDGAGRQAGVVVHQVVDVVIVAVRRLEGHVAGGRLVQLIVQLSHQKGPYADGAGDARDGAAEQHETGQQQRQP
jgi:hypothetical protein